jgi:hypothetical protein
MSNFTPLLPFAPQSLAGAPLVPTLKSASSAELLFIQQLELRQPLVEGRRDGLPAGPAEVAAGPILRLLKLADAGKKLPQEEQVLPPVFYVAIPEPAVQAARGEAVDTTEVRLAQQDPVAPRRVTLPHSQVEARISVIQDSPPSEDSAKDADPAGSVRTSAINAQVISRSDSSIVTTTVPPPPVTAQNSVLLLSQSTVLAAAPELPQQTTLVQIGPSVQHPDWGGAVAARVVWQISEHLQQAQFRIHPPDLGPVEVRVTIKHDQASVQFIAQHGLVRDALEDSIPRLREMMSNQGLTLADANVSEQGARDRPDGALVLPGDLTARAESEAVENLAEPQAAWLAVPSGRLDIYV